jgi:hypothetical protein
MHNHNANLHEELCPWCGEDPCQQPQICQEQEQLDNQRRLQTTTTLQCGLCGCAWKDPKPVSGRPNTYYCDSNQGGCERLTQPQPRTDAERLEFERWQGEEERESKILGRFRISNRVYGEIREDAIYRVQRNQDNGLTETPVLAMPCSITQVVMVEGIERVDAHAPTPISGTFEELYAALRRSGRILDKRHGQDLLALLAQDVRSRLGVESGRETYEVFTDEPTGRLTTPIQAFPQPNDQAEEWNKLLRLLDYKPTTDEWEAFLEFEGHFTPKEVLPAKAACAYAPFARLLRTSRIIVPSPFHVSSNSGSGKTAVAEAYSKRAWGRDNIPGKDLNSDFRFAYYLSGACTTLTVEEAESFDWEKHGATIKHALESATVASRGRKDLSMVRYPSRRVLLFTANHLPALGGPTLARLFVVRFSEDRRNITRDQQASFDAAETRLGPVGPSLGQAGLRLWKTHDELIKSIHERAQEIEEAYGGRFSDNRRARCWAMAHLGLEAWEEASNGIHVVPPVYEFVEEVVRPIEQDAAGFRQDRLATFKGWFDRYRSEKPLGGGQEVLWGLGSWTSPNTGRSYQGFLITRGLLEEYDRQMRTTPGLQIGQLAELPRLVSEAYPISLESLKDEKGNVPRCRFAGDRRQRAAWVPEPEPEEVAEYEKGGL